MAVRFNVEKFRNSPGYYHLMDEEQLAFRNALNRNIVVHGREREIRYYYEAARGNWLRVIIPFDTGEIKIAYDHHFKNEKAVINLKTVEKLINASANFIEVCAEHGYLIYEKEVNNG